MTKTPLEHVEQVSFVNWFRSNYQGVLIFAIPNGGLRNISVARKLQAEGVEPGIPDLFIPAWRLWIEMKRAKGGRLSQEQIELISYLDGCGYSIIVGHGFEDAKKKVLQFIDTCVE